MKERLKEQLIELGKVGRVDLSGVSRPALSEADIQARRYVRKLMEEARLDVVVDDAGNIIGTRKGRLRYPYVSTGSHTDTVLNGGIFDGALGVLGGIEAVRMLNEEGVETELPLAVIDFTDEEGAYYPLGGSKYFVGAISSQELYESRSKHDNSLFGDRIATVLEGARISRFTEPIKAHLELHIEQGPLMERQGKEIGVVTGIVGMRWVSVILKGTQSHAGTTPMDIRHDPTYVAAKIVQEVRRTALAYKDMVGTVGSLKVRPNVSNVIAGEVELNADIRSLEMKDLESAVEHIVEQTKKFAIEEGVEVTVGVSRIANATLCDTEMMNVIKSASEQLGYSYMFLPSRAGHDTENIAKVAKVGMIFVPSRGGVSHAPKEFTDFDTAYKGVEVLKLALQNLSAKL